MKLLILDTEPSWLAHWQALGVTTATTLLETLADIHTGNTDTVMINATHLEMIPVLIKAGATVIVTSRLPSNDERIAAYRAGAAAYTAQDFRETAASAGGNGKAK